MLQATTSAYLEIQSEKMIQATKNGESSNSKPKQPTEDDPEPHSKRLKSTKITLSEFMDRYSTIIDTINPYTVESLINDGSSDGNKRQVVESSQNDVRSPTYLEHLVNAIGHPSVLKQISEKFLQNVSQYPPK